MTAIPRSTSDQAARLRDMVRTAASRPGPKAEQAAPRAERARTSRIIAFASGKGGVGKTSLCVNSAVLLAQQGLRTTLLDADLGLANADLLLGVTVRDTLAHVAAGLRTVEQVTIDVLPGLRLVPGASGLAAMADLAEAPRSALIDAMRHIENNCDALLIDCGAGVGASVLAFIEAADVAVIVTTPEPTAIADAYATIKCAVRRARRAGHPDPALCLLVNQANDAAQAKRVFDRVGAVASRFLGYRLASVGWVPRDDAVSRAVCARRPLAVSHPRSSACRAMHQIVGSLVERTKCAGPVAAAPASQNPRFWGD